MNFTNLLLHGLEWSLPSVCLTVSLLLWLAIRGRWAPLWGYWMTGLILCWAGWLTQALTLWVLRWPDGSLTAYGALILVLATLAVCLTRPKTV